MSLAESIAQVVADHQTANQERNVFAGTVQTVAANGEVLTVVLDGSGVAIPVLNFTGLALKIGRRIAVIKVGSDLVVFGSFGDDAPLGQSEIVQSPIVSSTTISVTSFTGIGTGVVFITPPSGKVKVHTSGFLQVNIANGTAHVSTAIRLGDVIGSGTLAEGASTATGLSYSSPSSGHYVSGTKTRLFTLTPNTQYNAELCVMANATGSGTSTALLTQVIVEPAIG